MQCPWTNIRPVHDIFAPHGYHCLFSGGIVDIGVSIHFGFSVIDCPNACFYNGDCVGAVCVCYRGWTGRDCSKFHCDDLRNCSGQGECVGPNVCKCYPGFMVGRSLWSSSSFFKWLLKNLKLKSSFYRLLDKLVVRKTRVEINPLLQQIGSIECVSFLQCLVMTFRINPTLLGTRQRTAISKCFVNSWIAGSGMYIFILRKIRKLRWLCKGSSLRLVW